MINIPNSLTVHDLNQWLNSNQENLIIIDVRENMEIDNLIIEKINIAGNSVTNDSVIRGELLVDEGDPYSELLVNRSLNELRGRNIFSKVSYTTSPGTSSDVKVLELRVEEKATGEIMAGAGVGTAGTSFQVMVKENNWLGKGMKVNSSVNVSTEKGKTYIFG